MAAKREDTPVQTLSERALANLGPSGGVITVGGVEFKGTRLVTVPTLSHNFARGEVSVAIEFVTAFVGSPSHMPGAKKDAMTYAARVINLVDGKEYNYVGSTVILSELKQAFPHDGYVGKKVVIRKLSGPSGKRYNSAEIIEVA